MRFLCGALTIAGAVTACQPIPELAFGDDDASVDAGADAPGRVDARADAAGAEDADAVMEDATIADAPDTEAPDASVADASVADAPAGVCPASPPQGATVCCDTVPCKGAAASCNSECTNCKNNCHGKTCCLDHNGNFAGCASSPSGCQDDEGDQN